MTGELIEGLGTEDSSLSEGTVTYDVRFRAVNPVSNKTAQMIINVEGQNNFYPGYPLVKRGIYYGSRLISSQYGTVFAEAEYGKIQKVSSIWVCMNPPKYRQNTINLYEIHEKHLVGDVAERREHYDLMTVIMICLGDPDTASTDLLKLLDVLFSEVHSAEEKKQILVNEFDIKMTKSLEGEVEQVCDYSNGIWDKGHTQGRLLGREEEREMLFRLIDLMAADGEAGRIPKLSQSPEFLDEMLEKYQLR